MPNFAGVLKEEVRRLARKEIRLQVGVTKRAAAQHRRDIADLKRSIKDLARRMSFLEGQEKRRVTKVAAEPTNRGERGIRFSPRWIKSHREKLGLSAADYGKLLGVSTLTVYNWENGKAKPRAAKLAALAEVRGLRKREAERRLSLIAG